MWELFSEYTESSSLHGVKYVGEKKRHWSERFEYNEIHHNQLNKLTKFLEHGGLSHLLSH